MKHPFITIKDMLYLIQTYYKSVFLILSLLNMRPVLLGAVMLNLSAQIHKNEALHQIFSSYFHAFLLDSLPQKIFKVYLDNWWLQISITSLKQNRHLSQILKTGQISFRSHESHHSPSTVFSQLPGGSRPRGRGTRRDHPTASESLSKRHLSKCHDGLSRLNSKVFLFLSLAIFFFLRHHPEFICSCKF